MAVLCPAYRLLFIGNTRTGSTAIGRALVEDCGGIFLPATRCVLDGETVSKKHSTLRQLIDHRLLDVDPGTLLKFVAIRNPFDSVVSHYMKLRFRSNRAHTVYQRKEMSFRQYVEHQFRNRTPRSMHRKFVAETDEVIRFEALQEGLSAVLAKVSAPDIQLPVINKTEEKRRHYSEYYDRKTRKIVGDIFAEDLERFGYSFEETGKPGAIRWPWR